MKRKGYLYIYIHQVFRKSKSKKYKLTTVYYSTEKGLHSPRTIVIIGLSKVGKVIQRHKVVGGIVCAID
jgi:RNase P protein component